MPAIGPVVLNDRKATPVAHTFVPNGESNGVWALRESSGIPIADNIVTVRLNETPSRVKANLWFTFPVVVTETVNGVSRSVIDHTARAKVEFDFSNLSTEAERKDVVGMVYNSLASSQTMLNDVIVKLQQVY